MSALHRAVLHGHAGQNTVYHALFGYFYLGMTKKQLAHIYCKHVNTISNWIARYEDDKEYMRKSNKKKGFFTAEQKKWMIEYYQSHPLSFLDESKKAFYDKFRRFISISTIWRWVQEHGMTWKVLERRAVQIRVNEIVRFTEEMNSIDWNHYSLQFLDEVSFDNRGMLRTRGYCMRGEKLIYRGEFTRKARVSLLCFLSVDGITETCQTEGTFDRGQFIECCRSHALTSTVVKMYPGRGSVWVLDGAKIHCHCDIVYFLRSVGLVVIFLPPYCPFFHPIEYAFGLMKKRMKSQYKEGSKRSLDLFIADVLDEFTQFDMSSIYEHCGWSLAGVFDPRRSNDNDKVHVSQCETYKVDDLLDLDENIEEEIEDAQRRDQ
ncbi:hypothetical protein LEN26_005835 [Aphanomyces euteiches]|nr:hypothetical protein LEN26_005835 [Aphanomyces euteiches]